MTTLPLPDADARDAIVNDLRTNLVVEAAAGTGKTTCLVARLLNLFKDGALAGENRLAAVTFTHKAASELRERLERGLADAVADQSLDSRQRRNLRLAAAALPDCHIGTIHSFCARLLRERPVEAGLSPDFREVEETDDLLLRRRAWGEFADRMRSGYHKDLYSIFELFGLDRDSLGAGFERFADYPDIAEWPGDDAGLGGIDVSAFVNGVADFHAAAARFNPDLDDVECGNDKLLPILQVLCRRFPRLRQPIGLGEAFRLSGLFKANPKPVQKQWKQLGLSGDDVGGEIAAYLRFWEGTVRPFRRQCLAAVYGAALRAFHLARDHYDRLRREHNVLNFQDLLMASAAMLRDFPVVRADLAERYALLLVDEVQDTDPIQAEIMFLLASADGSQRDWRRCPPRPGALFIVGDPKQSIYRFRRADIVVYQEVKRLVAASGGRVLGLSTNFRSQPDILAWVNATFSLPEKPEKTPEDIAASGRFGAEETPYSPGYVPLQPGQPAAGDDCFHGVYALETIPLIQKEGVTEKKIVQNEAERIARFIRHAVDGGLRLPSRSGPRPAGPGDFLIVTYQKASAPAYADALRRLGLECLVSSGGTLSRSPALALLRDYLFALANPRDPVRLVAVLRGGLFGVSDAELYRWKKSGGAFDYLAEGEDGPPLGDVFAMMRRHRRLANAAAPAAALPAMADDLGLWAYSALGDDPVTSAGVFATAVELLRNERGDIPTLGALADRLEWLMDKHEQEPLPARERAGEAVRVMNLHKTKGLEAPVVFLTTTRGLRRHDVSFAVSRTGEKALGGMVIQGGEFGNAVLAEPADWEELAAREELFQAAEKTRLNYVAATRAGAALIVSVHQTGNVWKSAFLPEFVPEETIPEKLPESEAAPPVTDDDVLVRLDADALEEFDAVRTERRPAMLDESYRTERAKPDSPAVPAGSGTAVGGGEEAMAVGEVLHRLLEAEVGDIELEMLAGRLLREFSLPAEALPDVVAMARGVRKSALWRRATAADRMFREAPFAIRVERDGEEVLQRGVIDLAFREEAGWVIADYKSDRLPEGTSTAAAAARHAGQLAAYARAWEALTGEPVAETGIFYLRGGEYVQVDWK